MVRRKCVETRGVRTTEREGRLVVSLAVAVEERVARCNGGMNGLT